MMDFLGSWTGILVSISALAGLVASAFGLGWRLGKAHALRDKKRAVLEERLKRIYGPLRALLLNVHIVTYESAKYPYLRQRLKRFVAARGERSLRYAVKKLFDRGVTTSSEVEYGGDFPRDEISRIASANADVSDPALLDLIQNADVARYGTARWEAYKLSREELSLASHIWTQYERLSKKLGYDYM